MAESNENQELLDLANPSKSFKLFNEKLEVKARSLSVDDFIELQSLFPGEDVFDVNGLLNSQKAVEAFAVIVWLGVRKDTPKLEALENVRIVVNIRALKEWRPVVQYVGGVVFADDDDDAPPPKEDDEAAEPKNA